MKSNFRHDFHDDDESGLQLIDAGAGDDTIQGRDNLKVLGGDGNDTVTGGASYFDGGAGDDTITLPDGNMSPYLVDYLDGGTGSDTLILTGQFGSSSFGST